MSKFITVITAAAIQSKDYTWSIELLEAVLEANGRASNFVYDENDIIRIAVAAEQRLDAAGLPMAARVGFEVTARSAGPVAASYKYTATGTQVTMRRTGRAWVLVKIAQSAAHPRQKEQIHYRAPEKMRDEIARRSVADIGAIAA